MEQTQTQKSAKSKRPAVSTVALRVKRDTKRRVLADLAKVNKKDFGRTVRCDALISLALSLISDEHVQRLQNESMSNADRLEQRYRDYVKVHGSLTKDEYLGVILGDKPIADAVTVAPNAV